MRRKLLRDQKGSVAVTFAVLATVLIGIAGIGVDLGMMFTDRRKAQSVADLAALAAVGDLTNADKAAAGTLASNHLANGAYSIQYGVYSPDPTLKPDQRFAPSSSANANAARITVTTTTPLFLSKLLVGKDSFSIQTTATASRSAFASFSIGSRLLSVQGGVLNQLLGGLLGANLSLSVMDYQALLDTQLDCFTFLNALATRLQLTAGTYSSILSATAKIGDLYAAMADAGRQQFGTYNPVVTAMTNLANATQGLSAKVKVGSLLDIGPYSSLPVGQTPKVGAAVSAYGMVSAAAEIANSNRQIEFALQTSVPGIASATIAIAVGERPQGVSWTAVGPVGTSVYTAQTRILIKASLVGTPPAALVTLPIYIDIASGNAQLTGLTCGFPDIATSRATLGVTPGVVDAWIGDVSPAQMSNFSTAPNPAAATLVDLAGLKVTGRAHVSVGNMTATPVTFTYSDIQQATKKTVGTTNFTTTLLSRLISDTQLSVAGLPLGIGSPLISSIVSATLSTALSPIDGLLSTVLQTLGVGLGQADVWVPGIRCDGAVLVI